MKGRMSNELGSIVIDPNVIATYAGIRYRVYIRHRPYQSTLLHQFIIVPENACKMGKKKI